MKLLKIIILSLVCFVAAKLAARDPVPELVPVKITYKPGASKKIIEGRLDFAKFPIELPNGKKIELEKWTLLTHQNKWKGKFYANISRSKQDPKLFFILSFNKLYLAKFDFAKIPVISKDAKRPNAPVVLRVEGRPKVSSLPVNKIQEINPQIIKWHPW